MTKLSLYIAQGYGHRARNLCSDILVSGFEFNQKSVTEFIKSEMKCDFQCSGLFCVTDYDCFKILYGVTWTAKQILSNFKVPRVIVVRNSEEDDDWNVYRHTELWLRKSPDEIQINQ